MNAGGPWWRKTSSYLYQSPAPGDFQPWFSCFFRCKICSICDLRIIPWSPEYSCKKKNSPEPHAVGLKPETHWLVGLFELRRSSCRFFLSSCRRPAFHNRYLSKGSRRSAATATSRVSLQLVLLLFAAVRSSSGENRGEEKSNRLHYIHREYRSVGKGQSFMAMREDDLCRCRRMSADILWRLLTRLGRWRSSRFISVQLNRTMTGVKMCATLQGSSQKSDLESAKETREHNNSHETGGKGRPGRRYVSRRSREPQGCIWSVSAESIFFTVSTY